MTEDREARGDGHVGKRHAGPVWSENCFSGDGLPWFGSIRRGTGEPDQHPALEQEADCSRLIETSPRLPVALWYLLERCRLTTRRLPSNAH
jgi:hypothetical protein